MTNSGLTALSPPDFWPDHCSDMYDGFINAAKEVFGDKVKIIIDRFHVAKLGFDHGAGHPLLFLDDAKLPNCRKNNGFMDLGNYSEWPKVAVAVIKAVSDA